MPDYVSGTRSCQTKAWHRRPSSHSPSSLSATLPILAIALHALAFNVQAADNISVLFQRGLATIDAGLAETDENQRNAYFEQAISAFRTILIDRPDLVRVRLELARAYFFRRKDSLATKHFERVLAIDLPAPVATNIRHFLFLMRQRRRWRADFGFALASDTNINSSSNEDTVYLFDLPFRLTKPPRSKSGVGITIWTSGAYYYPLSPRLRLRASGRIRRSEYGGSEFDEMNATGTIGPLYHVNRETDASLLAVVRRNWAGSAPESDDLGARIEANHRIASNLKAGLQGNHYERSYKIKDRKQLDGPRRDATVYIEWFPSSTLRIDAAGGWVWERPKEARYDSNGQWLRAGLISYVGLGFSIGGSIEWRKIDFDNFLCCPPTLDFKHRTDRNKLLSITISNRAFSVFGYSPQLALVRETRETNAQILDYRRSRVELRFVRSF